MRVVGMVTAAMMALAACATPTRYRLPLAGNPDAHAGLLCTNHCETFVTGSARWRCIANCPGVEVEDGSCSATDVPPTALCRSLDTPRRVPWWRVLAATGAALITMALLLVYVSSQITIPLDGPTN